MRSRSLVFAPVLLVVSALSVASCGTTSASATVELLVGYEADAFSRSPAPTTIDVDAIDSAGKATSLLHGASLASSSSFDLGSVSADLVASIRVTAHDDTGSALLRGESLEYQLGGLDGAVIPVFVQRTGEWARLPLPPDDARPSPALQLVGGHYVLETGGNDPSSLAQTQIYDLGSWAAFTDAPLLPRPATSVALADLVALAIDPTGASWIDLTDSQVADAIAPDGGTFADVAGGQTVTASDGTTYVVGPTRTTSPSARALRVSPDGTLAFIALATARMGASATWVDGHGVVVAGGSTTGAGVEVVAADATSSLALPYPPDGSTGAGIAALDPTHLLLAGGRDANGAGAGARTIDLGCATACAPAPWQAPVVPPLVVAQAFAIDAQNALVIGDSVDGVSHALRLSSNLVKEIPFKIPRNHARALALPTGEIFVAGGQPLYETFTP